MEEKVIGKKLPVSQLKARLVAKTVIGMKIADAVGYLRYLPNKSSNYVAKIIMSAVSNMKNKVEAGKMIKEENLFVKNIFIGKGPFRSVRRGRIRQSNKKKRFRMALQSRPTSHITVIIEERITKT